MKRLPIHALILCNGDPPSRSLASRIASAADMVIAADGGANIARQLRLRPDVILGDLDSISPATRRFFRTTPFLKISRQDSTDLEKALTYAQQQGIARVTILGSTGRRIDFTFGNMAVLWNYARRMEITVAGDGWLAKPVVGHLDLRVRKGCVVILIPFGPCSGITLRGLL